MYTPRGTSACPLNERVCELRCEVVPLIALNISFVFINIIHIIRPCRVRGFVVALPRAPSACLTAESCRSQRGAAFLHRTRIRQRQGGARHEQCDQADKALAALAGRIGVGSSV